MIENEVVLDWTIIVSKHIEVEIPKEAQQGQQQAAGPSCIIF